ncbi:SWIM zinc finger [Lachnospiraceae bacterium RM5]|nr:SWIM zinc finger [Lachnospiraceae bacterium RM5]
MGLVEKAPKKIIWRAIEYYKQNKILNIKEIEPDCYEADVSGSGKKKYNVFIDMKHPKKSTCTCPFATENDVICKHMVAVYFMVKPEYIKDFIDDEKRYSVDKDYRWQRDKEKLKVIARKMSKEELVDELAECWLELESYRKRDI